MAMTHVYTDATGLVGFGDHVPDDMLPVFRARSYRRALEIAQVVCRHSYDGRSLIVAPVRDVVVADEGDCRGAVDALRAFRKWIAPRKGVYV